MHLEEWVETEVAVSLHSADPAQKPRALEKWTGVDPFLRLFGARHLRGAPS